MQGSLESVTILCSVTIHTPNVAEILTCLIKGAIPDSARGVTKYTTGNFLKYKELWIPKYIWLQEFRLGIENMN